MKALHDGPDGQWWKDSRIFISGWVEIGGNLSSSQNQPGATGGAVYGNAPYVYDSVPNSINLTSSTCMRSGCRTPIRPITSTGTFVSMRSTAWTIASPP
jgi:hypothetical protein